MLVDFKRPTSHIKYLSSLSSYEWINLALSNPIDILIDHAHCERKAAGVAIQLMFRYPSEPNLAEVLSPIAREELEHFEKILYFLKDLGHSLKALKPPPYGAELAKNIRKDSLRKSSLLKIFEICNSTKGIFDPIKASRIEIEV